MAERNYKNLAIELAKKIAKERDNYTCQKPGCGRSKKQGFQIHASHIMPVTYGLTAADPENIIALCSRCHLMSPHSWHQSPAENWIWFEEKYPGLAKKMWNRANPTRPIKKWEWREIYLKLKSQCDFSI